MIIKRNAKCFECGKTISVTKGNRLRDHGPMGRPCKGSDKFMRDHEITVDDPAQPSRGTCRHCGAQKRVKQNGTVFRHFDGRVLPRPQQGWCLGSDEKPVETS